MKLKIIPFGNIPEELLKAIADDLKNTYGITSEISITTPLPKEAFNSLRHQYSGEKTLNFISKNFKEKILGVTDQDLYAEDLNFIFGQAQLKGNVAIISIHRLDQRFYKKPENKQLLKERAVKEAIHEVGHMIGLNHCPNEKCVMCFSNTIFDVDKKGKELCEMCKMQLGI